MASDKTVDGLESLYGRVDAVVHDAGTGWRRSRGLGDGHCGRHCCGGPSFEACNDQHETMGMIDDKAECDGTCIPSTWHEGSFMAFVKAAQNCFSTSAADNRVFRPSAYPQEAFPP